MLSERSKTESAVRELTRLRASRDAGVAALIRLTDDVAADVGFDLAANAGYVANIRELAKLYYREGGEHVVEITKLIDQGMASLDALHVHPTERGITTAIKSCKEISERVNVLLSESTDFVEVFGKIFASQKKALGDAIDQLRGVNYATPAERQARKLEAFAKITKQELLLRGNTYEQEEALKSYSKLFAKNLEGLEVNIPKSKLLILRRQLLELKEKLLHWHASRLGLVFSVMLVVGIGALVGYVAVFGLPFVIPAAVGTALGAVTPAVSGALSTISSLSIVHAIATSSMAPVLASLPGIATGIISYMNVGASAISAFTGLGLSTSYISAINIGILTSVGIGMLEGVKNTATHLLGFTGEKAREKQAERLQSIVTKIDAAMQREFDPVYGANKKESEGVLRDIEGLAKKEKVVVKPKSANVDLGHWWVEADADDRRAHVALPRH